jgi:hypothetical protein
MLDIFVRFRKKFPPHRCRYLVVGKAIVDVNAIRTLQYRGERIRIFLAALAPGFMSGRRFRSSLRGPHQGMSPPPLPSPPPGQRSLSSYILFTKYSNSFDGTKHNFTHKIARAAVNGLSLLTFLLHQIIFWISCLSPVSGPPPSSLQQPVSRRDAGDEVTHRPSPRRWGRVLTCASAAACDVWAL